MRLSGLASYLGQVLKNLKLNQKKTIRKMRETRERESASRECRTHLVLSIL